MNAASDDVEAELLAGLKAGDPEAFRVAVTRYSGPMLATARAIVGPANAEDIVQDAWLAAYRQIGGFEGRAALGTWLQRIVANRAISHLRSRARESVDPDPAADEPETAWFDRRGHWKAPRITWDCSSPEDLLAADALQDCIDKHLELMPANQRQVLVMRDMQALPVDDICNELAVSASNVRVLLHRARVRLMKMVDHFQVTGSC